MPITTRQSICTMLEQINNVMHSACLQVQWQKFSSLQNVLQAFEEQLTASSMAASRDKSQGLIPAVKQPMTTAWAVHRMPGSHAFSHAETQTCPADESKALTLPTTPERQELPKSSADQVISRAQKLPYWQVLGVCAQHVSTCVKT